MFCWPHIYSIRRSRISRLSGLTGQIWPAVACQADEEVYGKGAKFQACRSLRRLADHLCRKAHAIACTRDRLHKIWKKRNASSCFYELELPLADVLTEMEMHGVKVETKALEAIWKELEEKLHKRSNRIYELAGTEFNINSTEQLGEILFEKLGLPVIKKTKTGYSTDAEVLERLAPYHEIVCGAVDIIVNWRSCKSTYVEGLLKEIRPRIRIRSIRIFGRRSPRPAGLSSQFPNLQNIPIRLEEGRKIRQVFVPSEPGCVHFGCGLLADRAARARPSVPG